MTRMVIMPATSPSISATSTLRPQPRRFNANDRKYRCCCGDCCHVRTGSMIVGALEIILISLAMIASVIWFVYEGYRYAKELESGPDRPRRADTVLVHAQNASSFVVTLRSVIFLSSSVALGLVGLFTIALLFAGVIKEKACLLIPHLIIQILIAAGLAALAVYAAVLVILDAEALLSDEHKGRYVHEDTRTRTVHRMIVLSAAIFTCIMFAALCLWFFAIVRRCYRYLRDATDYERKMRQSTMLIKTDEKKQFILIH